MAAGSMAPQTSVHPNPAVKEWLLDKTAKLPVEQRLPLIKGGAPSQLASSNRFVQRGVVSFPL